MRCGVRVYVHQHSVVPGRMTAWVTKGGRQNIPKKGSGFGEYDGCEIFFSVLLGLSFLWVYWVERCMKLF